jgi:transcriptional regulator with PAS, ATPase and Fis domain
MPLDSKARFLTESLKLPRDNVARWDAERQIFKVIRRHAGNVSTAALELGVGRATLNRWIASNELLARHVEIARKKEKR